MAKYTISESGDGGVDLIVIDYSSNDDDLRYQTFAVLETLDCFNPGYCYDDAIWLHSKKRFFTIDEVQQIKAVVADCAA